MYVSTHSRWLYCVLQVLPLKPGDFPLYSNRSRAAAQAMLAEKQMALERREIIIGRPGQECPAPRATDWCEDAKERTIWAGKQSPRANIPVLYSGALTRRMCACCAYSTASCEVSKFEI